MVTAKERFRELEMVDTFGRSDSAILSSGAADLAEPDFDGIRRIVVPLDGSRTAEHALPHAIAIARRSGASIRLVHVFSLLESFGAWEQTYHHDVIERYRREKHRYMNSALHSVRTEWDGYVAGDLVDSQDVAGALATLTDANSLMIMATRSRGFVKKLFKGSVADALIRKLKGPLLLVRGVTAPPDLSSDPMPRHILIPLDGTECAERVIAPATQLGALNGARYSLAHLRDAGRLTGQNEISAANAYLKDVARRSGREWSVASDVLVSERSIATDLIEFANKEAADWIAVTAHDRPWLTRLLHRSVAKTVVRRAAMPVLVVRHPWERERECEQVLVGSLWA